MTEICYLCGQPVAPGEESDDHVVPKQLIQRKQPKAKGFEYAGVLPSHKKCNNEFGPEVYCQKALMLIRLLHDEKCFLKRQHRAAPGIEIMAINADCLPGFTQRDLKFFRFIDGRHRDRAEWSNPSFFSDKPKIDPLEQPLRIALAVLAKNASALLVSRRLKVVPARWQIVAVPYLDEGNLVDFDALLGETKPFDIDVKVWLRAWEKGDWFALYKARGVLVFFLFWFSGDQTCLNRMSCIFNDADRFLFAGMRLVELVGYQWKKI